MSCLEQEDTIVDYLPGGFDVALLPVPESLPLPVVAAPDGQLDRKQWEKAIRGLPALAEPIVIDFKEMPRTGTGKIQREELRRRYLDGAGHPGTGRWT
jgi:acyl-CoA synthetase (AMP-forming)/AMP-acid ligase II